MALEVEVEGVSGALGVGVGAMHAAAGRMATGPLTGTGTGTSPGTEGGTGSGTGAAVAAAPTGAAAAGGVQMLTAWVVRSSSRWRCCRALPALSTALTTTAPS